MKSVMENFIFIFMMVVIQSALGLSLSSQSNLPFEAIRDSQASKVAYPDPPIDTWNPIPEDIQVSLTSFHTLPYVVLLFGLIVMLFLFILIKSDKIPVAQVAPVFMLSLVLLLSSFVAIANIDNSNRQPLILLLGVVSGYLLSEIKKDTKL